MVAIITVAVLTLLGSFLCSLFEAALYAITPSKLELLKAGDRFGAQKLAALRVDIEEPISAILTVNTITHTVGAAWCGAMVAREFGDTAIGVFAAVFTFAVLVLSEIIPKSIGVRYATLLGPLIAWPLQLMVWSMWPVVKISKWLIGLFAGSSKNEAPTEAEVMVLSRMALAGGELRAQEHRWVENALRLDAIKARDLMTPRTVVVSLDADLPLSEIDPESRIWAYSRIPLTEGNNPDRLVGMVYRREVFGKMIGGETKATLREMLHPIDFIPESMPGHELLDKFLAEKKHLTAIVDEYGGFEGLVSLEDVLECLLGTQIVDESDPVVDMQEYARDKARDERQGRLFDDKSS